jgi:hypothetical protein
MSTSAEDRSPGQVLCSSFGTPHAQLAARSVRQRAQPEFPQAELEQKGRDDGHQPERLGGGRAVRGVRPVEGARGSDQTPDGQAGSQARFSPSGAADEQHRTNAGRAVERQEEQVRPGAG